MKTKLIEHLKELETAMSSDFPFERGASSFRRTFRECIDALEMYSRGIQDKPEEATYLPCPFCGSDDVKEFVRKEHEGGAYQMVACNSCDSMAAPSMWNFRPHYPIPLNVMNQVHALMTP